MSVDISKLRPPRLRCPRCDFRQEVPETKPPLRARDGGVFGCEGEPYVCAKCRLVVEAVLEPADDRWWQWATNAPPPMRSDEEPASGRRPASVAKGKVEAKDTPKFLDAGVL